MVMSVELLAEIERVKDAAQLLDGWRGLLDFGELWTDADRHLGWPPDAPEVPWPAVDLRLRSAPRFWRSDSCSNSLTLRRRTARGHDVGGRRSRFATAAPLGRWGTSCRARVTFPHAGPGDAGPPTSEPQRPRVWIRKLAATSTYRTSARAVPRKSTSPRRRRPGRSQDSPGRCTRVGVRPDCAATSSFTFRAAANRRLSTGVRHRTSANPSAAPIQGKIRIVRVTISSPKITSATASWNGRRRPRCESQSSIATQ